jgi:hypothetical protein
MSIAVWVLQFLLAFAFCAAGAMKVLRPKEELRERMNWVEGITPRGIKVVGTIEILGGLGLVLPAITGILPVLTPLATIGLIFAMGLAINLHVRRREPLSASAPAIVLLLLLVLLLVGLFAVGRN